MGLAANHYIRLPNLGRSSPREIFKENDCYTSHAQLLPWVGPISLCLV